MTRVFIHPLAGVLSAYGMGLADVRALREQAVEARARRDAAAGSSTATLDALAARGRGASSRRRACRASASRSCARCMCATTAPTRRWSVALRRSRPRSCADFEAAHRQRFGFVDAGASRWSSKRSSVEAVGATRAPADEPRQRRAARRREPLEAADEPCFSGGAGTRRRSTTATTLRPGDAIDGPGHHRRGEPRPPSSSPAGRRELTRADHLVLERVEALPARAAIGTDVDPVMLEVFNNLFMAIAEQMGSALQNTAYSVNIKERLDFSCALFDARAT